MRFERTPIAPIPEPVLRALGARNGWLIESTDMIRCGFGESVASCEMPMGLEGGDEVLSALRGHELFGSDGPSGSGVVAFGSLPFDRSAPARLEVARYLITQNRAGEAWLSMLEGSPDPSILIAEVRTPSQEAQSLRSLRYQPTPEEYAHQVARAVEILRRKELDKVVLARCVSGSVPESLDAAAIAARLRVREPICTIYSLPTTDGRRYVGASPELLARRSGPVVQCHPLAGTIALPSNVAPDDYETWLLGSTKNLHEHGVLVDDLVRTLADRYDDISVDPAPSIVTLRTVAHLGTWITGVHHEPANAPDALEVLAMLHPTAAVGGIPRRAAYELIRQIEQRDRGHYAGPLGWLDANGDGEWWIGLRGVLIAGSEFEAWAGAGIVSESDPTAEREETKDKLASVLSSVLVERV
ncbi:MAG TPA: isochorismate synthase [Acidimicrobiales bacterium]|nr:isochorismate synthase [Acidimicrobiales bacterium]